MALENVFKDSHSWKIIRKYFEEKTLVSHQIESYNDFVTFGIQGIIDHEPPIVTPNYRLKFGHVKVDLPQVIEEDRTSSQFYPHDARMRDLTYDTTIYCDLEETYIDDFKKEEKKIFRREPIGRLPVMLKSCICTLSKMSPQEQVQAGECPYDYGGYFIVKGNERVLTGQMRSAYNQIFVLSKGIKKGERDKYIAEVRPMSEETSHTVLLQCILEIDNRTLCFSLPYIKERIPVGIVFKALGYTEDDQIKSILGLPDTEELNVHLKYILRDSFICQTTEQALAYIGRFTLHMTEETKRSSYAKQVTEGEILPHLGISANDFEYAYFLGYMVRQLLCTNVGLRQEDDRDNYANKRVEIAGTLLHDIFRNLFKKYIQDIKQKLEKRKQRPDIISIVSRIKRISKGLHQCIATGNWVAQKNASYVRTGVSQVLDRMTYFASISHLRRIIIPIGKQGGKNNAIRQIHCSSFGYVDPAETPEGAKVGVVLNMALLCRFTKKIPTVVIKEILEKRLRKYIVFSTEIKLEELKDHVPVFLNNGVFGFTKDSVKTVSKVKKLRITGVIDKDVSVAYDPVDNIVKIFSDEGRFSRPLINLTRNTLVPPPKLGKSRTPWTDLVEADYIRYLDPFEIEHSTIAMTPVRIKTQYNNYCEIHPSMMLGIMASLIPFPDHSQSPRNCYSSAHLKQALGVPSFGHNIRMDTKLHVLYYPQKPLVGTKIAGMVGMNEIPSGINAMVAIASWANNQEDSICINQSSLDRGLFCVTSYHTIDSIEKKRDTYSSEKICLPPMTNAKFKRRLKCNYNLLDETGVVKLRNKTGSTYVQKGDVIIGKVLVSGNKSGEETMTDDSVVIQSGDEGYVDSVYSAITPNGYRIVKVKIRQIRPLTLADKLASRTAQKGTNGMIFRQEDMPFTAKDGMVPDIILNPCAFPSRMTLHQLIETLLGKEACVTGEFADATPFTENSTNIAQNLTARLGENLQKYGFESHGWETMISGTTGEIIKAKIYFGPTYYQRLKHMVDDKMHVREFGQTVALVRQPLEGRAREGGLRFGEMEKDCTTAHGASFFTKERLFYLSDPFKIPVCKRCGMQTARPDVCQVCQTDDVAMVNIPYAAKLLTQETASLCLKMKIRPSET